jgi:hypothetical protein
MYAYARACEGLCIGQLLQTMLPTLCCVSCSSWPYSPDRSPIGRFWGWRLG